MLLLQLVVTLSTIYSHLEEGLCFEYQELQLQSNEGTVADVTTTVSIPDNAEAFEDSPYDDDEIDRITVTTRAPRKPHRASRNIVQAIIKFLAYLLLITFVVVALLATCLVLHVKCCAKTAEADKSLTVKRPLSSDIVAIDSETGNPRNSRAETKQKLSSKNYIATIKNV